MMGLLRHRFVTFIVVLLLPLFLFAQDNSKLDQILKRGELRVGTSGNQPPFSMKSKDGQLFGYEIDLANMMGESMQLKVIFVEKPFAELLPALEKGEIDLVMSGMTITPKRNLRFTFAGPYMISGKSILAKAQRLTALDEMDEINRPTIKAAALKGSTSELFIEKVAPEVELIPTADYDSAVKMVLQDEVDLFVADYPICLLSVLRYPEQGLATLKEPLTIEPIGIAMAPEAFRLHNLIDNYLNALQIGGVLSILEKKWFEDGSWLIRLP